MNYFLPYGHRLGCLYSFILLVYSKPILHLFIFLLFSGHFFSFVVYEYLNTKSTLLKPNVLLAFVLGEIKVKTCQANLSSTECPPPKKKCQVSMTHHPSRCKNTNEGKSLKVPIPVHAFSGSLPSLQTKAKITESVMGGLWFWLLIYLRLRSFSSLL